MSDILVGTFTVSPQEDRILLPAHGLINGNQVLFALGDPATGALPFPLNEADYYFVVGARGNDFMVSATSGGALINVTDRGTGSNEVWKRDEGELLPHQMSSTVTHHCTTDDYYSLKVIN